MNIKVVHLSNYDVALNIHLKNYICYLRDQAYDVKVVCSPGKFLKGDGVTDYGVPVKAIHFSNRYTPLRDLKTLWQLYRYFRQEKFDIVHTHTVKPGLLGRLAARLAGVPIVVHTVHGFHIWHTMSAREIKLMIWIERFASRFCDSLMSQNREDMAYAVDHGICPPQKIRFLGNGIDVDEFHPDRVSAKTAVSKRQELGLSPDEPVVGMIGRLVQLKGYHEYIEAARILKERGEHVRFLAIGAAQAGKAEALSPQELIAHHGVEDKVLFLGVRHDVPELMKMMDGVVLASYAEGIPRILMEAAAMGRPSIGTDVRGTREVIVD
ncbi:MAG: glycosyltransferase family 4 protein, partial [Chloroflexi bacterium]|nr:glycosyltransferase family 4 protein [Chloroflexota bacterium]